MSVNNWLQPLQFANCIVSNLEFDVKLMNHSALVTIIAADMNSFRLQLHFYDGANYKPFNKHFSSLWRQILWLTCHLAQKDVKETSLHFLCFTSCLLFHPEPDENIDTFFISPHFLCSCGSSACLN